MLAIERQGAVLILRLDRPERRNALGEEMIARLEEGLRNADENDAIRSIVLAAAPPAFCAGSDLKELGALSISGMCKHELETARVARQIGFIGKPVIAAVEGFALGGGFILAASCDIVVSASDTRWHLPEVQNGWIPPWGLQALAARVGPVKARLLTWGGEAIDGTRAEAIGLADYVTEPGSAFDRAIVVAEALAKLPAGAIASTKRYFEPLVLADAERQDELATRIFAADCNDPVAQQVLARFGTRA